MPRKQRKAAATGKAAASKASKRKSHIAVFNAGNYDLTALFRAAARGEIESPDAMHGSTEAQRRHAISG